MQTRWHSIIIILNKTWLLEGSCPNPFLTTATRTRIMTSHVRWIALTQYGEKGLGGLDRHGEERAGVLALIRQADVTDSDCELLPRRSHQLDPVIPQSCVAERREKKHRKERKRKSQSGKQSSRQPPGRSRWRQLVSDIFVIQTTFSRGRASAPSAFVHFECVTRCQRTLRWPMLSKILCAAFAFQVGSRSFTVSKNGDDTAGRTQVCRKRKTHRL